MTFTEFQKKTVKRLVWPYSYQEDSLIRWRAFILSSIILTGLVFGSIALISAIGLIFTEGAWLAAIIDLSAALLGLIFLFVEKIRYEVRAFLSLLIFFVIGVTVILSFGPLSGGPAWLFAFAVLAGVLVGKWAAFGALLLNTVALIAIGFLIKSGYLGVEVPVFKTPQNMIAAGVNFIVLNIITTVSVSVLLKGMVRLFEKKEILAQKLEIDRKELLSIKKKLESEVRKRASAVNDLIETKNKYKKFVDDAPMAMYTINRKGEFTYANQKLLSLTGYRKEDWIGRPFHPVIYPDDLDIAIGKFQNRLDGKEDNFPYEIRIFHSSGDIMWVEIFSETLIETDDTGQVHMGGAQSFLTDITDRKKAEDALQESEQKYRNLFELESDAILLVDCHTGAILESNSAAVEMYGFEKDEFIGLNIASFEVKESEPNGESIQKNFHHKIIDHKKRDGSIFQVEVVSRSLDWNGSHATLLAIRDVTWRIEIEAEQIRLEKELNHARKMESIGTLAGGIAHDFNNILHMMIGNCELAMDAIQSDHPIYKNLSHIKESGLRAADIVKQLLSFSSRNDHVLKPIEAVSLVRNALLFLRSSIPKTIEIKTVLPDHDIIILANSVQITQVLMNLCTNASQVMESTGGVIEIRVGETIIETVQVELSSELSPGPYLEIQVIDDGPGINPDIIDKIFDPYFTTKGFGKGYGMGLAFVHGILRNHNGLITVKSDLNRGAAFKILLPQTQGKPEIIVNDMTDEKNTGSGHLLFVDDEELIAQMNKESLEEYGYKVTAVLSPTEALDMFKVSPQTFDMIITDMTMPGMRGDELSQKILHIRHDIPIIICSGYSSFMDEQKAQEMGIAKYLTKPVIASELSVEISRILNRKGI